MAYESLLMCKKCHSNLVIPKRISVKKLTVYVWASCAHCKKQVRFTLPLPQVHEWVDAMAGNFFRCPKCGVAGVVTRSLTSGNFTKLKVYCPSCQKAFIKVAAPSVYSYLMASNYNQMKKPPTYVVQMPSAPPTMPPAPPAPVAPPVAPPAPPLPPATPPAPPVPPATTAPPMKKCTNCEAPLPPGVSFCRKCGVPVEAGATPRCPFCGATISEKAKVCPKCSSSVRCEKCDSLLFSKARFCVKCGEPIKGKVEEVEAPKVTCHFCGAPLELEQKVCPECGKPTVCPQCGNHLKSGVRFCNKCGMNVAEITLTTPERKEDEEEEEEEFDEDLEDVAKPLVCSQCGAHMNEEYTFCTICGTRLDQE
ncbi:MAG: zinc ribbon domain-containing protein [Candidatus Helarchaeota archaeon]|nr:zinc ribbon domain-containing protein [Candidatus Helarchaeota archaeon]